MKLLFIAVLGLCGVFSRYYVGLFVARILPTPFPLGTFIINVVGSFLIGFIYAIGVEKGMMSESLRVGLLVGFLGGFTTFSSFALDSVRLAEQSEYLLGGLYFFGSPIVGFIAATAGLFLARITVRPL